MKTVPNRKYTAEFRAAAASQVLEGGRPIAAVARSLEMSAKSLANWIYKARKGKPALKCPPARPVSELEAEVSRLRQENATLKTEKAGHLQLRRRLDNPRHRPHPCRASETIGRPHRGTNVESSCAQSQDPPPSRRRA